MQFEPVVLKVLFHPVKLIDAWCMYIIYKKKHWSKTSLQPREYSAFYHYKKWNNLQHKFGDQAFLVLFNVENQIAPLFSCHSHRGGEGGVGMGVEVFCLGYVPTIPHSECHIWDKW